MQTWLVTGAHGFLGRNAGAFLRTRVHALGQVRSPATSSLYEQLLPGDLRDTEATGALIRSTAPDVVLHAAAISGHEQADADRDQAEAVNVHATAEIARACADIGARLVYISTDSVFSGSTGNYSEGDEPEPFSWYGESKLLGEAHARNLVADHLIVRTNFFGWSETGRKSVLEFFVNSLRAQQHVRGYPDFVVTSIYAQQLIDAIWRLSELGATGTFHVASSDALSKYEFGMSVAEQFGLDSSLIAREGPPADAHTTSRARNLSLNTSKAAAVLGSPLATQAEGIRQAGSDEPVLAPLIRA
ncbi:MAG: SDR family oxidoreductase [Actinomycetota bacterium]|nr:SDR family oxidoreductase [Actinomycetota bacterium]MDP2287440.1 SDR family oxidoreductase [Actinomycetota bacterium]